MATLHSKATPTRLSPVQQLQTRSPYTDFYTRALTNPLRLQPAVTSTGSTHGHPEPMRWQNPGGWGSRHMNDCAPFSLWTEHERRFRSPNAVERAWIRSVYGNGIISLSGWFMCIETKSPPQPIPFTLGCMPVYFVAPGESHLEALPGTNYPNPRVADPCPTTLKWPRMAFPTREQNTAVLQSLAPLVNIRAIVYMPSWIVVEITPGDGREYEPMSLPGIVAGRTTLYHHGDKHFFEDMKDHARVRAIDPQQHGATDSLPQDTTNYLLDSLLTPGCRVECGFGDPGSVNVSCSYATTCGVKIRNSRGEDAVTVANQGFLYSTDVYHPHTDGTKIGDIIDRRPEIGVGLLGLAPKIAAKFTNGCYFQATPPSRLLEGDEIMQGSWSEMDGMSSGLITMMAYARIYQSPPRSTGYPAIDYRKWQAFTYYSLFGVINTSISEGVCGAPIVNCDTGGVGGFFHMFDGSNCLSAHLDDLVAEWWQVV